MKYKHIIIILTVIFCLTLAPGRAFAEDTVSESIPAAESAIQTDETTDTGEADFSGDDWTEEPAETETDTPDGQNPAGDIVTNETAGAIVSQEEDTLALRYDDYYEFSSDYPGYEVAVIRTETVLSQKVSAGVVFSEADSSVVELCTNSRTKVVATGTGTATVVLTLPEYVDTLASLLDGTAAVASDEEIPTITVNITVSPAPLTIMFLAGQSNMEASCSAQAGYQPQDSIACREGQVYSTFSARDDQRASLITGVPYYAGTVGNVKSVVAGSLGYGSLSVDGGELAYPLNALTESGNGKTGPDSGLAYEWNQLSGDKVWCVNAAWGASTISMWAPGGVSYEKAAAVFSTALQTYEAEISAGHYTRGSILMLWLQGETDRYTDISSYYSDFVSMYNGLQSLLGIDYWGIISVRASLGDNVTKNELTMSSARTVQYNLASDEGIYNLYVVSNANEQWVSDTGVCRWFYSRYPDGTLDYPLRSSSTLSTIPTTVEEVHSDIHYSQVAHNENGIDAAWNMYSVVYGAQNGIQDVAWRDSTGIALSEGTTVIDGQSIPTAAISVDCGEAVALTCITTPVSDSKMIHLEYDTDAVEWDAQSGVYRFWKGGIVTILAKDDAGNILEALRVEVNLTVTVPTLVSAANTGDGIKITWTGTATDGYAVFRKTGKTNWQRIASADEIDRSTNTYLDTDVNEGQSYTYTVRALYGTAYSGFDKAGVSCVMLRTPELLSAGYASKGIAVTWSGVTGAKSYNIYRKTDSGNWSKIGTSTDTAYTDTSAKNGVWYTYTVRAVNSGKLSNYDPDGLSAIHTATPTLTSAVNADTDDGIRLVWKAVTGADSYRIYRKTAGSTWTELGTVTGTTYFDPDSTGRGSDGVTYGITYIYTVRAVNNDENTSGYNTTGIKCTRLQQPELISAVGNSKAVQLTWNAVTGAASYNVYRKTADSNWSKIASVSGKTLYSDTSAKAGKEYIYTVRAVKSGTLSTYDAEGVSGIKLATPTLISAAVTADGVQVSWKAVAGAEEYRVYRKVGSSKWEELPVTADLYYEDKNVTTGVKYTYTVRALRGENISGYNSTGVNALFVGQPALKDAEPNEKGTGITVSWTAVQSATGYNVYRKTETGKWTKLKTVTGQNVTSICDYTAVKGTVYTYTVRAVYKSSLSAYDEAGVSAVLN